MKNDKPDYVSFTLWPIVGGVAGWLMAVACYLQGMAPSNPTGTWMLQLPVLGSVLATSTWAGRHQPRCFLTLYLLVLLIGFLLWVLAPTASAIHLNRVTVAFGLGRLLFLVVDLPAVGCTLAAIYGLTRWPRVLRAEAEQLRLSQLPSVLS